MRQTSRATCWPRAVTTCCACRPNSSQGAGVRHRSAGATRGRKVASCCGRRKLAGDSRAALIAEIMHCEPALGELSPPQFAHVVECCLEKDPQNRWQTTHDVALELRWIKEEPAQPTLRRQSSHSGRRQWAARLLMAGLLAGVLSLSRLYSRLDHPPAPP